MHNYSLLHNTNILVHVVAGSLALIIGVVALISQKHKGWHTKSGRYFLILVGVVVATGLFGVFVFKRNTFLLIITVLSAYYAFSGYRILKAKSNTPKVLDIVVALLSLSAVSYFLYYFKSMGMYWSPVIVYSTVGMLIIIILYDFIRYMIPTKHYKNMWLYEHIFKMIGAFTALLSAFSGTVFSNYQPYSQFYLHYSVRCCRSYLSLTMRKRQGNVPLFDEIFEIDYIYPFTFAGVSALQVRSGSALAAHYKRTGRAFEHLIPRN